MTDPEQHFRRARVAAEAERVQQRNSTLEFNVWGRDSRAAADDLMARFNELPFAICNRISLRRTARHHPAVVGWTDEPAHTSEEFLLSDQGRDYGVIQDL